MTNRLMINDHNLLNQLNWLIGSIDIGWLFMAELNESQ